MDQFQLSPGGLWAAILPCAAARSHCKEMSAREILCGLESQYTDNMQSFTIRISGKVQGVSFREYAKGKAYELRLNGFIRNEPDGSVYAEVEGEEEDLKKFIEWCHEGPESAKVDEVKGTRQPFRDFQ